ncbi:MAG: ABC transporter permease [bacterium]|nr:ABC transporter permease [bacterium]
MNKEIDEINSRTPEKIITRPPSLFWRIYSVWFRHVKVYTRHLFSNGLPPFIEPLFFLAGIGLGLGKYVGLIDGTPYIQFLAAGIIIPSAMYTASFECTFGTFIRLEFDKVYDGMIASSITINNLLVGEMLFAATKSFFFSGAVLIVVSVGGLIESPWAIVSPVIGFFTGLMFASFSLFITSFVANINHFNFYFTGLLTPMFFFSGIVFPLNDLPLSLQKAAEVFPLTHSANLVRAFCFNTYKFGLLYDVLYIVIFILVFGFLAIRKLEKRIVA